ncbi:transposase, partial [Helicobacter pylori]|uniref:transposase n=1 Tax=Helicobacter pylori TaxID=210 RepID=UPI0030EE0AF1
MLWGKSAHFVGKIKKVSVSKLVNSLKGVSSRLTRQHHFKSVEASLWGKHLWSPSYF